MTRRSTRRALVALLATCPAAPLRALARAAAASADTEAAPLRFLALVAGHPGAANPAIDWLRANWRDDFAPCALDTLRFVPDRAGTQALTALLTQKTGDPTGRTGAAWIVQKRPFGCHLRSNTLSCRGVSCNAGGGRRPQRKADLWRECQRPGGQPRDV